MTTMWSATSMASSWSWVTKTVVTWVSSWRRRSQMRSSLRTRASRAPKGSSRRSTAGLDGEGPGEGHALPLAARELGRIAVGEMRDLDEREQLPDLAADLLLGALADGQPEGHVVPDGHVLEGRVVLEDEADAALLRRHVRDVPVRR